MENFKIESRYLNRVQGCYQMYEGCFLQTILSKALNVSIDQKIDQKAACLYYNTAHAIPVSHGNIDVLAKLVSNPEPKQ